MFNVVFPASVWQSQASMRSLTKYRQRQGPREP